MNSDTNTKFLQAMDASLSTPEKMALRRALLADTRGKVLEIGIGGGLNLACYPPTVQRITAVDVYPQLLDLAIRRANQARVLVDYHASSAERLPFADNQFDSIVSTWTLCSVPDVAQALAEICRVLKPDGRFYFVEHGLSPDRGVRFWQNCLNPLQKKMAGGCNLNRDMPALMQNAGLVILELKTFYTSEFPRTHGYTFLGKARSGRAGDFPSAAA